MSGRPTTSAPPSSIVSGQPDECDKPTIQNQEIMFVPHITDLVYFAHQARQISEAILPARLLGPSAVDTATLIGEGASFSALRRSIPPNPQKKWETWLGGLQLISRSGAGTEKRPRTVVFKSARIEFDKFGEPVPRDRGAMHSVMREFFALVHPPLIRHPNIVTLLGLGWGSNPYQPQYTLPTIVLEYADCGTLADIQDAVDLTAKERLSICADVAAGLNILHRCGIVHGDVKSENVLIFTHPEKRFLAKLGDFGFSRAGDTSSVAVRLGGTRPWIAPEVLQPILKADLHLTDVYSYGLLVWRVAANNANPFALVLPQNSDAQAFNDMVMDLKQRDVLIERGTLDHWYIKSFRDSTSRFALSERLSTEDEIQQCLQYLNLLGENSWNNLDDHKPVLRSLVVACPSNTLNGQVVDAILLKLAAYDPFLSKLATVFRHTLGKDPKSRDLSAVTNLFGGQSVNTISTPSDQTLLLETNYRFHNLSWQQIRDLRPNVQKFLVDTFSARATNEPPDYNQIMTLSALYINGYGVQINYHKACELLIRAARAKYFLAAAYCYRICHALEKEFWPDDNMIDLIYLSARAGSRTALEDLEFVAPERASAVKADLRNIRCGVGASFYDTPQMTNNMNYTMWMTIFDTPEYVLGNGRTPQEIRDWKVNRRGDSILHLAATSGKLAAMNTLLDCSPILEINLRNILQETLLLVACRAGQKAMVELLLARGADASLTTPSGESCLHWLISFDDADVETVGDALIAAGGNLYQLTIKDIAYSHFPAGFETDFQLPGSPLMWATHHNRPAIVKFFMSRAKDAGIGLHSVAHDKRSPNAVVWAAHFQHHECLQIIMDALLKENFHFGKGFQTTDVLVAATHSTDTFSMLLRHGALYKQRLRETFRYLIRVTRNVQYSTGIGGFGFSLLYFAVAEAHDVLVEYLLSDEVAAMLASEGWYHEVHESSAGRPNNVTGAYRASDINLACGEEKRTPLLEAVYWNRVALCKFLIGKGADIHAKAQNPYVQNQMSWSALHILAEGSTDDRCETARNLVALGVPIDSDDGEADNKTETPLMVAVQSNCFNLSSTLLSLGANINALRQGLGWTYVDTPTTILGLIIASAARNSAFRLRYLLFTCPQSEKVDFIVEPGRALTALHRAAMGCRGVYTRSPDHVEPMIIERKDYDFASNREIMYELLQRFNTPEQINRKSGVGGKTALHMAVESGNVECIRLLTEYGADWSIEDNYGKSVEHMFQPFEIDLNRHDQSRDVTYLMDALSQLGI